MANCAYSGTVFSAQTNTRMAAGELLGARGITSGAVTFLSTKVVALVMRTIPSALFFARRTRLRAG